ncbi:transcription factor E2F8 [Conger conger]|uniref:transcription factor E2F8 n=1 Tax=Conger conger TaxID=82655 RepID=UPI002A5A53F6|nr:transcription factor E2F8 [Conger conger]XP_061102159.1 transcription factor E2F8 [Conger conger]
MSSVLVDLQNFNQKPQIGSLCDCGPENEKGDSFTEPYALTKTPRKQPVSHTLSTEPTYKMGSLTTPTKGKDSPACEPWTPTSNLKILLSAASPEIRNRAKELCGNKMEIAEPCNCSQEPAFEDESEKLPISRKEKSLGLLCHKFLARYPDYPNPALSNNICLDDVAGELNVERRRIYDIMNVLESLHMVSRLAKNRYTWHGRANLPQTLAMLKKVGDDQKYGEQMQQIKQKAFDRDFDFDGEEKENEGVQSLPDKENEWGQKEMLFVELPGVEFRAASVNSRKDKSLRVMSQKFVMLFLVTAPRVVSLEVAAKILIGEDQVVDLDKSKYKTKIRRLYDIANVLSSLQLIKKVHVTELRGRKPAFTWTGPEDFPSIKETSSSLSAGAGTLQSLENCTKNLFPSSGAKRGFTRHPSLIKLAKSIQDDRRKISSAPTSPIKVNPSDSESYPSKMDQLAAICKIQLDEQSKKSVRKNRPAVNAEKIEGRKTDESTGAAEPVLPVEANDDRVAQVQYPVQPARALSCIPVLLPQHAMGGSYAVYMHPSSVKPHPSGMAVRSMTFEEMVGGSPSHPTNESSMLEKASEKNTAVGEMQTINPQLQKHESTRSPKSPASALKRPCTEVAVNSPSKALKTKHISQGSSPDQVKLSEMRARLKARRGVVPNRPSPRALHLDPEFVNTPESAEAERLDRSVEKFLEKEEVLSPSDREAGLTPLRAVPLQEITVLPGHLHNEALIPTGYLIPISHQSLIRFKDPHCLSGETVYASVPNHNVHRTPTAGSMPVGAQEFTPTRFPVQRASAVSISPMAALGQPGPSPLPGQRMQSPSPAILNFTLQNLGLIPAGSPGSMPPAHRQASPVPTQLGLQQGGVIFVKPMSPMPLQHPSPGQPLALLSLQQPLMGTPKGTQPIQQSFFHTPGSTLSPLAAVVTSTGQTACKTAYIPQRKLEISTEDALCKEPGC